ncbi:nucleotidyltransferase [Cytobacillus firmus]|uniref:nucleotidyltransferase domain-containing protein n=1 Tax=Cytobacillus firmus TaxID=1399 RepID=UPI00064FE989|nr:nucleotidyltransferase [Cytobacillus firmus]KML40620.1 hypothetical protein VL14_13240 [Cytobacillus firmus]
MVKNVDSAFNKFIRDVVDLESEVSKNARRSRDWLYDQLKCLPDKSDEFPHLFSGKEVKGFGSFRRRTKIRPLDDIDLLLVITGEGTTYTELADKITLQVPEKAERLKRLTNDDGTLNSKRLIEKVKKALSGIHQYENAEIHRREEAATLKLKSYDWVFDIVPAFITAENSAGKTYYIIPDGSGNWKKTDPRIDNERTTEINKNFEGKVLSFIRLVKYWNTNVSTCTISSYLIENLVLNFFSGKHDWQGKKEELKNFFSYLKGEIYNSVLDPKQIQGDLNHLNIFEKMEVSDLASKAFISIDNAIQKENEGEQEQAIGHWKEVFGKEFPTYEG